MKTIIALLALATTVVAQDPKPEHKGPPGRPPGPPRPPLTEEQKKARAEVIAKYDTNKDGKLDKEERKAVSKEDRKKLGPPGRPPKKD